MFSLINRTASTLHHRVGTLRQCVLEWQPRLRSSAVVQSRKLFSSGKSFQFKSNRANTSSNGSTSSNSKRFSSDAQKGGAGAGSNGSGTTAEAEPVSLWKKALTLYCVLFGANYISNAMIHPTQKMDYGVMNKLYPDGREVNSPFWGTRLPHLFLIPTFLTAYDLSVTAIFARYFGLISFAATPAAWLLNLYVYTFLAVGSFISFDAALNPAHEGKRMQQVTSHIKPLTIGMGLQWHAQMMLDIFGSTAPGVVAILRNAFAIALVFLPVKSLGFGDFGENGLSPHERKMNNLPPLGGGAAAAPVKADAATSTDEETPSSASKE